MPFFMWMLCGRKRACSVPLIVVLSNGPSIASMKTVLLSRAPQLVPFDFGARSGQLCPPLAAEEALCCVIPVQVGHARAQESLPTNMRERQAWCSEFLC